MGRGRWGETVIVSPRIAGDGVNDIAATGTGTWGK